MRRKPGKASKTKNKDQREQEEFRKAAALCTNANGIMSCMPPSIALLDAWDVLDVDRDGQWSIQEAKEDLANTGCHVGVRLEDIFRAACRGIVKDSADTAASGFWGL